MVNILVPTDFSDLSKVALNYAIDIANKLEANITLLHVVHVVQPTRASMRLRLEALEEEMIKIAEEEMQELLEELGGRLKVKKPLEYHIVKGSAFGHMVKQQSKKLKSGLVVMGTHGASGIKRVWGSNTASFIEISHIPVLAVPPEATFNGFQKLIYATDLKHLEIELDELEPYVKIFGAKVDVFHVVLSQEQQDDAKQKIQEVLDKGGYTNFQAVIVTSKEIDHAIESHFEETKGDLIATFTHKHSLYEKLFEKQVTKKLAFHNKLPLLVFRQAT